jgi:hypothetical protein
MNNHPKLYAHLQQLIGTTLEDVRLACEMIVLDFGSYGVHAQGFARILEGNRVLLTTLDYQNWDEVEDTNNDEWYNLAQYKDRIVHNKVTGIALAPTNDLTIYLEHDIMIQSFISNGPSHYAYFDEQEQWRFLSDADNLHIVVTQKSVEFQK